MKDSKNLPTDKTTKTTDEKVVEKKVADKITVNQAPEYDLRELLEAGMHFGHQKNKWNPRMSDFIYMEKEGVHIFDLAKTAEQLQKAYNYLFKLGQGNKNVIFVGTKRQAKDLIKTHAKEAGVMYMSQRWIGGLLTNWNQVKKSIKRMLDIEKGLESGKFDGYTKFERVQLEKERNRLARFFDGVRNLKGMPDCIVVIDAKRENIAVTEANIVGVPVVALIDSNSNPDEITLPIPGNDDAVSSIEYIIKELTKAYAEGKAAK